MQRQESDISQITESPEIKTGSKLEESYELLGSIGSGGMGSVEKARHRILGHFVAIKKITERKATDRSAIIRFTNEARAASRLKHENLSSLREFGIDSDGSPYAIMDFVEGVDLSKLIEEQKTTADPQRVIRIAIQIAQGLQHAHGHGIVHRDIKPSNIIIHTNESGKDHATIVDFGIAKINELDAQKLTQTGEICGSPHYLSPEQGLGRPIDHRTDIYSLGCVMYECLTGMPPYVGENFTQTVVKHVTDEIPDMARNAKVPLPAGLAALVTRCLSKEADGRFKSAEELLQSLTAIAEGRKVPNANARPSIKSSFKKYRFWIWAITLLIGLTVMAVFALPKLNESTESDITKGLVISEFARVALKEDNRRAMDLFNSGRFIESAYSLQTTNDIMAREIQKIEEKLPHTEAGSKKAKDLERTKTELERLMNENLVHMGLCFSSAKQYKEAIPYFEKARSYFHAAADHPREIDPRSTIQAYNMYIQTLKAMPDPVKLAEIQAEFEQVKKKLDTH